MRPCAAGQDGCGKCIHWLAAQPLCWRPAGWPGPHGATIQQQHSCQGPGKTGDSLLLRWRVEVPPSERTNWQQLAVSCWLLDATAAPNAAASH